MLLGNTCTVIIQGAYNAISSVYYFVHLRYYFQKCVCYAQYGCFL